MSERATYILSLTHLMKVGPPSNDDYLCIARVAKVGCQLSLARPVPAYIEEDLDDNEYDDNSTVTNKTEHNEVVVRV